MVLLSLFPHSQFIHEHNVLVTTQKKKKAIDVSFRIVEGSH